MPPAPTPRRNDRPARAPRRSSGDSGQTSAEYLGLVVVVAAVIAALVLGAAGMGTSVNAGIQAAICRISGGTCTVNSILHEPTEDCEVLTYSNEVGAEAVAFSVELGGSAKLTLHKTTDNDGNEKWYVTQEGEVKAGANFLIGQKAKFGDLGAEKAAEIEALVTGGGGSKLAFSSESEAREFMKAAAQEPVKQAVIGWDPTGLKKKLVDNITGTKYDPPEPDEYFFQVGETVQVSGSAESGGGKAGVGGSAGVTGVVGVKVTPIKDSKGNNTDRAERTVYLKMSGSAALELGLLAASAEGAVDGEVQVGITYDENGKPKEATVEAAGTLRGSIGLGGEVGQEGTIAALAGFAPKGAPVAGVSEEAGVRGKMTLKLDLREPGNADALANSLHSLGAPIMNDYGSEPPPGIVDGVRGLYDRFDSGAAGTTITATTQTVKSGGGELELKGGDGLTFGIGGNLASEDVKTTGGYYYSPGEGFVKWQACSA